MENKLQAAKLPNLVQAAASYDYTPGLGKGQIGPEQFKLENDLKMPNGQNIITKKLASGKCAYIFYSARKFNSAWN